MTSCVYCDQRATHRGEGEDVCTAHIPRQAADEYRSITYDGPCRPDRPDDHRWFTITRVEQCAICGITRRVGETP